MTETMVDPVAELRSEREAAFAELEAITKTVTAEGRGALSEEERESFQAAQAKVDDLDDRIAAFEATEKRRKVAATKAAADGRTGVQVGAEPRTYSKDAERREGVSFLRDLMNKNDDPGASDRLRRHMAEAKDNELRGVELRAVGTGAFAGLTVPQYLTDLVAPVARPGRVVADLCNSHPLPADGMTVNISRITTATSTAIQATENATVSETNADDTLLTVNVRTIAGMQDVSRQAVDRSSGADAIIVADLMADYDQTLDNSILNDDGTSGTHLGIRSTSGIVAVTYTSATPTAAEAYPKLFDLVQQIQSGVFAGADALVFHPRRWWWFASQVGSTFPFIQAFQTAGVNVGGQVQSMTYGSGPAGIIAGLPAYLDANIPTNVSTNQDVILGITRSELHLWEDAGAPLMIRSEEVAANSLTVRFVVYGYSAFTAGRYPGAHGTISGTGLATPTF